MKGPSLPFLVFVGDDLDQSPERTHIHCIIKHNYRNFIQSLADYFYLWWRDIFQKEFRQRKTVSLSGLPGKASLIFCL